MGEHMYGISMGIFITAVEGVGVWVSMAAGCLSLAVSVLCLVMTHGTGLPREIFVDDDNPSFKMITIDDEDFAHEETPCHIDYQVMKRVVGTCVKLGRSGRGCVAGNYVRPLHPECM